MKTYVQLFALCEYSTRKLVTAGRKVPVLFTSEGRANSFCRKWCRGRALVVPVDITGPDEYELGERPDLP